jgi:predicted DNA-binding protein with PD1-like motif
MRIGKSAPGMGATPRWWRWTADSGSPYRVKRARHRALAVGIQGGIARRAPVRSLESAGPRAAHAMQTEVRMRSKVIHESDGERTIAVVFDAGDEVMAGLVELAGRERLSAAHFTGIGALSAATLGFFDLERKEYVKIPVGEQVEVVSLAGNIARDDGRPKVHAHLVVSTSSGAAMGGHLLDARVRPTLEIVVVESPRHLRRTWDPATGLALLDLV